MTIEEMRKLHADTLKEFLRAYLLKIDKEKQKSIIEWMMDEYGYGRNFFLTRDNCVSCYNEIIENSPDEDHKIFFRHLIVHTDNYGFALSALMASLDLYKEFIDSDFDNVLKFV